MRRDRARARPDPRRQRGFALLIVLWTTALLALIGAQVTSAGRTEAQLAGNLRGAAIAEAAADAAVREAALRLLTPAGAKWVDGPPYVLRLPQAAVEVSISSESSRLPLNTAPLPELMALIGLLGVDPGRARTIATQIADWRSPANFPLQGGAKAPQYRAAGRLWGPANRPFRSPEDLSLVLAMTPEVLTRLTPHISVYTQSAPKAGNADPLVLAAMRSLSENGGQPLNFDEPPIFRVIATARAAGGGEFIRRAVFRLNTLSEGGGPNRVIDILAWADGPPGPAAY
jgi:general secretion pathway protein K